MRPQTRRVERAEALLRETLRSDPAGLSGIALVDRLEQWGYSADEGAAVIQHLRSEGRILLVRGHFILADEQGA